MNELREIFGTLKGTGHCATQADFSRNWLGRSAHYLSQIGGNPRKASVTSLHLLVSRLELAVMQAKAGSDQVTYRKLRGAFVTARTIYDGVVELRFVPPGYRITALE